MLNAPPQNSIGGLTRRAKFVALSMLTSRLVSSVLRPLTRDRSIVFTLHRFEDPANGIAGHPEKVLRAQLELLRRERYLVLPLLQLVQGLRDGSLHDHSAIAFTVDDGYGDFARVGAKLFAEFDCPVTVFLPTAFIDGAEWLWWDRIEAAVLSAHGRTMAVHIGTDTVTYALESLSDRMRASVDITARLKRVPNAVRLMTIERIVSECVGSLPATPPLKYAPMSWDDVRTLSKSGVTFGPHTVTHPILPKVTDHQAGVELQTSWDRVRERTSGAIPIFSYPNGDFSQRDQRILARMGMAAAVSNRPQYIRTQHFGTMEGRYALPRFCHQDDRPHFVQVVSGLESAKENLRRTLRRSTVTSRPAAEI